MLVASLVFLLLAVVAALLGLGDLAGPLATAFQTAFFVFLACAAVAVAVDAARSSPRFRRRGTA